MKDLRYLFGRCAIHICASKSITARFPKNWQSYCILCEHATENDIYVYEESLPSLFGIGTRWISDSIDGYSVSTYYADDKAQFKLVYNKDKHVSVFIDPYHVHNLLLGIHHAVMLMEAHSCVGLHGVTVLCEDKVIILSAPSGTGKTTLANLLKKHTHSAVINGDFALLSYDKKEGVVFEPTPFCGTSGICHNIRLRVDRIVFLNQAMDNNLVSLSTRESYTRLMSNIFVPTWDIALARDVQENVFHIIENIPVDRFAFYPHPQAAKMLCGYITN